MPELSDLMWGSFDLFTGDKIGLKELILKGIGTTLISLDNAVEMMCNMYISDLLPETATELIGNMMEISATIGLLIMSVFFLVGIVEDLQIYDWKELSLLYWGRKLCQYAVCYGLVMYAPEIIDICTELMQWIILEFSGVFSIVTFSQCIEEESFLKTLDKMGSIEMMMYNIEFLTPKLVIMFATLFAQFFAYSRMLTVGVLRVIAPICFSTYANPKSSGVKWWFREYISTVGQGAIGIIACTIYKAIVVDVMLVEVTGTPSGLMKIAGASVVLIFFIFQGQNIVKQMI
jgi:hypothetical protein